MGEGRGRLGLTPAAYPEGPSNLVEGNELLHWERLRLELAPAITVDCHLLPFRLSGLLKARRQHRAQVH